MTALERMNRSDIEPWCGYGMVPVEIGREEIELFDLTNVRDSFGNYLLERWFFDAHGLSSINRRVYIWISPLSLARLIFGCESASADEEENNAAAV